MKPSAARDLRAGGHDGGYVVIPWLLIASGLSCRNRPKGGAWVSRSGARTTGDGRYGVPYGLDRLLFLFLATGAARQGRVVRGNVADVAGMFGVMWSADAALTRLLRVAYSAYEAPSRSRGCCRGRCEGDKARRHVASGVSCCRETGEFEITLTEEFVQDVKQGAYGSLDIVRQLCARPADLDLYLWQAWSAHQGLQADMPVFGEGGILAVLHAAAARFKARQQLRERQCRIEQAWPACPYRLSHDGNTLVVACRSIARRKPETHPPMGKPGPGRLPALRAVGRGAVEASKSPNRGTVPARATSSPREPSGVARSAPVRPVSVSNPRKLPGVLYDLPWVTSSGSRVGSPGNKDDG